VPACDYDDTLAPAGRVDAATAHTPKRLLHPGLRQVPVTGRRPDDLLGVFDTVVENGAVLHDPDRHDRRPLAEQPSAESVTRPRSRDVAPLAVADVVATTREPHGRTVLDTIRDPGPDLHTVRNRSDVVVLPAEAGKASGPAAALHRKQLSPHSAAAVGDAENDRAVPHHCECAAALANTLEPVTKTNHPVLDHPRGRGVADPLDQLLTDDPAGVPVTRHDLRLGAADTAPSLAPTAQSRPWRATPTAAGPPRPHLRPGSAAAATSTA